MLEMAALQLAENRRRYTAQPETSNGPVRNEIDVTMFCSLRHSLYPPSRHIIWPCYARGRPQYTYRRANLTIRAFAASFSTTTMTQMPLSALPDDSALETYRIKGSTL